MSTDYLLEPLMPHTADRLRREGGERYIADSHPGYPCRQCLRDAEVGEALLLVSHDPFDPNTASPYRSASPIFIHEESCEPPADLADLPVQLTGRQLSVRSFDHDAKMLDADVVDGATLDATLRRFLASSETDHVHVHNATRGCWATTVRRALGRRPGLAPDGRHHGASDEDGRPHDRR